MQIVKMTEDKYNPTCKVCGSQKKVKQVQMYDKNQNGFFGYNLCQCCILKIATDLTANIAQDIEQNQN